MGYEVWHCNRCVPFDLVLYSFAESWKKFQHQRKADRERGHVCLCTTHIHSSGQPIQAVLFLCGAFCSMQVAIILAGQADDWREGPATTATYPAAPCSLQASTKCQHSTPADYNDSSLHLLEYRAQTMNKNVTTQHLQEHHLQCHYNTKVHEVLVFRYDPSMSLCRKEIEFKIMCMSSRCTSNVLYDTCSPALTAWALFAPTRLPSLCDNREQRTVWLQ